METVVVPVGLDNSPPCPQIQSLITPFLLSSVKFLNHCFFYMYPQKYAVTIKKPDKNEVDSIPPLEIRQLPFGWRLVPFCFSYLFLTGLLATGGSFYTSIGTTVFGIPMSGSISPYQRYLHGLLLIVMLFQFLGYALTLSIPEAVGSVNDVIAFEKRCNYYLIIYELQSCKKNVC